MRNNQQNRRIFNICGCLCLWVSLFTVSIANAEEQPTAFGKTYGEWSAKWWQWVRSIPAPSNPLLAEGLMDCTVEQSGSVYFLAGELSDDPVERECTVPSDKRFFFSPLNFMYNNDPADPPPPVTVSEKREALNNAMNGPWCDINITLDGKNILFSAIAIARTQSPTFPLKIGNNDIFNGTPGSFDNRVVSDGYWVMLGLNKGDHTLHVESSWCGATPHVPFQDYTYILHVI